jgi:hypothetical protein
MTVLLLGDSNLVVLQEQHPDLVPLAFGAKVESRAVGGAWSGSLRGQVGDRDPAAYDAVAVGGSPSCRRAWLARPSYSTPARSTP